MRNIAWILVAMGLMAALTTAQEPGGVCIQRLVSPRYPPLARQALLQGTVKLNMRLDRGGVPSEISVIEGPPLLAQAASDAFRDWRFCSRD